MSLLCQGYAHHLLLNCIFFFSGQEVRSGVKGRVWDYCDTTELHLTTGLFSDKGGWGYLFGCVQQWDGLSSACLLDHLVKEPFLVLQEHIWLIVLLDPASIQNLQSYKQCRVCECEAPPVYFTSEKTDISAVSLLSDACRRCRSNGGTSSSLHPWTIHFVWLMQRQTPAPVYLLDTVTDNEWNPLAEWKSSSLTLTDCRSAIEPCVYPSISVAQGWSSVKSHNHTLKTL